MKCPKCQFENPSGIRYCLQCGERMLPLPPSQKPTKTTSSKPSLKATFWGMFGFVALVFCLLLITVVVSLQSTRFSGFKEAFFPEASLEPSKDSHKVSKGYSSKEQYDYVDFVTHTLSIPDSSLKIEFPAYSTCRYDYDSTIEQLIFEIETFNGLSITFTSSKLNASPYTKSEAEASVKTGLYYDISGEEDEYYYILPSNGPTANATIVDCTHNRSTNITVYDQHYALSQSEEKSDLAVENYFTAGKEESQKNDESTIKSEASNEVLESQEIGQQATEGDLAQEETSSEEFKISIKESHEVPRKQTGSQKAIYTLEELLRSAKINS